MNFNAAVNAPAGPPRSMNAHLHNGWSFDSTLVVTAVGLCVLRLVVAASMGLVDDESYYRLWSLAPALSYYDHPPMVAWFIGAGRAIAGDNPLGVRLLAPPTLLIGAALLWRTTWLLYGPKTARRATWILLAMPLLAVGSIIITPDLPSVLFSGAAVWALVELDRSKNANWWLAVGAFAGLGLLSKYTCLFLGAAILIWLLAVPENRRWFRMPQLYAGGLLALAIASPVIIWNAEHDWVSFAKQFGRVGHGGKGGALYVFEYVGGMFALASPVIMVLAVGGLARIAYAAFTERRSADVLLTAAALPLLFYFFLHALHDRVQGNWPAPIYPLLAIGAAIGLERGVAPRWQNLTFASALSIGFLITAIIYLQGLGPIVSVKEPTEQMRGWPVFADAVDRVRRDNGAAWIATSGYATTGQLAMALKDRSPVAQLNERIRYIFLPALAPDLLAKPALYVELARRSDPDLLDSKFRKVTPLGTLTRRNGSKEGVAYKLFLVEDPPRPPL